MYNDEVNRIPKDEDELWDVLWEQFEFVREILWIVPVENQEDARVGRFRGEGYGDQRGGMMAIRYRDVSDDLDQRDYFLELGRSLLPYIHQALDERKLTPEFVQQWGKIMFCHGFIAAHYFDDGDDFARERHGSVGGSKYNRKAQQKWVAMSLLRLMNEGINRDDAETHVVSYVQELLTTKRFPKDFGKEWYAPILTQGDLASTYDRQHLWPKKDAQAGRGRRHCRAALGPPDHKQVASGVEVISQGC